mmetsp:Transcript_23183/g.64689  ORF Transcript_23183/g.64689 Transcript_23183/m.64689 type:complete len:257 (-) Transcript_23183:1041-1811(-)
MIGPKVSGFTSLRPTKPMRWREKDPDRRKRNKSGRESSARRPKTLIATRTSSTPTSSSGVSASGNPRWCCSYQTTSASTRKGTSSTVGRIRYSGTAPWGCSCTITAPSSPIIPACAACRIPPAGCPASSGRSTARIPRTDATAAACSCTPRTSWWTRRCLLHRPLRRARSICCGMITKSCSRRRTLTIARVRLYSPGRRSCGCILSREYVRIAARASACIVVGTDVILFSLFLQRERERDWQRLTENTGMQSERPP